MQATINAVLDWWPVLAFFAAIIFYAGLTYHKLETLERRLIRIERRIQSDPENRG